MRPVLPGAVRVRHRPPCCHTGPLLRVAGGGWGGVGNEAPAYLSAPNPDVVENASPRTTAVESTKQSLGADTI